MTNPTTSDLIERLEKATGPDRGLDAEIAELVGVEHGYKSEWLNADNGDYIVIDECAPAYTTSLDAAMTLVPEGWHWSVNTHLGRAWVWPNVGEYLDAINDPRCVDSTAATPAPALTIAALKARAALKAKAGQP